MKISKDTKVCISISQNPGNTEHSENTATTSRRGGEENKEHNSEQGETTRKDHSSEEEGVSFEEKLYIARDMQNPLKSLYKTLF